MRKYLLAALMAVAMVIAIAPASSVAKKHTTLCPPGTSNSAYCVVRPVRITRRIACARPVRITRRTASPAHPAPPTPATPVRAGAARGTPTIPRAASAKPAPRSDGKCECPPGKSDTRDVHMPVRHDRYRRHQRWRRRHEGRRRPPRLRLRIRQARVRGVPTRHEERRILREEDVERTQSA